LLRGCSKREKPPFSRRCCNGFSLCAQAMRNPLIARLKDGSGFAHCSEDVPKGKNRPFGTSSLLNCIVCSTEKFMVQFNYGTVCIRCMNP
jgi:hypothetical protein